MVKVVVSADYDGCAAPESIGMMPADKQKEYFNEANKRLIEWIKKLKINDNDSPPSPPSLRPAACQRDPNNVSEIPGSREQAAGRRGSVVTAKENHITICTGSARQSRGRDKSCQNRNQNGSCLFWLPELAKETGAEFDGILMADIYNNKAPGSTYNDASSEDPGLYDASKITLLFTQMAYMANEYPAEPIHFYFMDDRDEDILIALKTFFTENSDLIPGNLTLHLLDYKSPDVNYRVNVKNKDEAYLEPYIEDSNKLKEPEEIATIKGSGPIRANYADEIRLIGKWLEKKYLHKEEDVKDVHQCIQHYITVSRQRYNAEFKQQHATELTFLKTLSEIDKYIKDKRTSLEHALIVKSTVFSRSAPNPGKMSLQAAGEAIQSDLRTKRLSGLLRLRLAKTGIQNNLNSFVDYCGIEYKRNIFFKPPSQDTGILLSFMLLLLFGITDVKKKRDVTVEHMSLLTSPLLRIIIAQKVKNLQHEQKNAGNCTPHSRGPAT